MSTPVPEDVRIWIVPLTAASKHQRRVQARDELEQILSAELGGAIQDLGIVRDDGGKPQLPGRLVNFNLSHCEQIAMIAVSRVRAVGIDLERARTFKNRPGLAKRICSDRELAHLERVGSAAELLRLWVRKEAVVKATGDGISRDLSSVDVLDEQAIESSSGATGGRWVCVDLPSPAEGYIAAVAFERSHNHAP